MDKHGVLWFRACGTSQPVSSVTPVCGVSTLWLRGGYANGRRRHLTLLYRLSKIERGAVTPNDLAVPFSEGMVVTDATKREAYVADELGNAAWFLPTSTDGELE